jgi:hypothetical protein
MVDKRKRYYDRIIYHSDLVIVSIPMAAGNSSTFPEFGKIFGLRQSVQEATQVDDYGLCIRL